MMEDRSEAFAFLKPSCDKLMQNPSKETISELIERLRLRNIAPTVMQDFQEYILFPLDLHLKASKTKQETKRYLIDCMKELLSQTNIVSLSKLFGLYTLLFAQIYDKNATKLVADVSEELKCSVVECAAMLMTRATPEVTYQLYDKKNIPKLSQGVYMCVNMAHSEMSRTLRLASIKYITAFAQVHDKLPSDAVFRRRVGDFVMFLLPGIVGGLMKVMLADEKQGHKVTTMALRTWTWIICIVMEDSESPSENQMKLPSTQSQPPVLLPTILKSEDREAMLEYLERHNRTPDWIRSTAEKLALLSEKLSVLQNQSHWLVRQELVSSCSLLLSRCSINLKAAVVHFLEILIMLTEDEIEKVSISSKEALSMFTLKCESENCKPLLEILEENFFSLVTKLPRILNSTNDAEQLSAIQLLAGYIRTLGASKLPEVLNSSSHLQRLVITLIQIVELDISGVSLLEEYTVRNLNSSQVSGLNAPWKQFRHFNNKKILDKTEETCRLLGQLGDLAILSDHFLDIFQNAPQHRKEIILLLNEILTSTQSSNITDHTLHIIKNVLDVYLEPKTWYVPLTIGDEEDNLTIAQAHNNLILACLLVEGLGKIAESLGRLFDRFLLRTLYLILERAGSRHGLLAEAGMIALERLARAGGHDSVTALICVNVDYFSYHVTMKLRRYEHNTGVLDVLNVVMKHSTIDVLPCIRDIVSDILLQSCDTFQANSATAFLRVFHTFIMCVRQWLVPNETKTSLPREPVKQKQDDSLIELKKYIESLKRLNKYVDSGELESDEEDFENLTKEDIDANKMETDENGDVVKKKVPGHIQMTVAVLTRCLHFLPSDSKQQKLLVLDTLQEGVKLLADWEDELLPVVHLIWSPLVGRFKEEPLVVNRSFALLCTLVSVSKDFVRVRIFKDVLHNLYKFLEVSASKSFKKDAGSAYRYTQEYKLQLEMLDRLGEFAVDLSFQAKDVDDLMTVTLPYLSHFQPVPLQDACVNLFKHLATYDRGSVWGKAFAIKQPNQDNKIFQDLQKNASIIFEYCTEND